MTTQEIIEVIKGLSVLELNDLVKACEEEFGVSAAAGVVVAAFQSSQSMSHPPAATLHLRLQISAFLYPVKIATCHSKR